MRNALLVPAHLLKSKSLLRVRCCWALPPPPAPAGSYGPVNPLAGGLGDPEREGALVKSRGAARVPRERKATSC